MAIMDHNDIFLPDRFAIQVKFMDEHPTIGVCGSGFAWISNKNKVRYNPQDSEDIEKALMCGIHHSSAMIRRTVLMDNHVKYEKKFSPAEDYALWCRLLGHTQFYNISKILVQYRKHTNQTSHLYKDKMQDSTELIYDFVRKKNPGLWTEVCDISPCIVRVKLFNFIPLFNLSNLAFIIMVF